MWKITIGIAAFAWAFVSGVNARDDEGTIKARALAHYTMAMMYDLDGQASAAVAEYQRSISFDAAQPLPHLRLAAYFLRGGQLDKSIAQLKAVLQLEPQNNRAHYLMALVYSTEKKYDQAAREYEQILKAASKDDPGNLEIYIYLAQLYFSQAKYGQAIEQFDHILKIQPDNVSATFLLGSSYLEINERGKAKPLFRKVLSLQPDHDGALNSLAYMDAEDGVNIDEALKMARQAAALDPSNGAYFDTLGWVLFKKGMNSEALLALQKAEARLQDPIIYDHMADVYKAMHEFSLARKFWQKSLDLDSRQPLVKSKLEELDKSSAKK